MRPEELERLGHGRHGARRCFDKLLDLVERGLVQARVGSLGEAHGQRMLRGGAATGIAEPRTSIRSASMSRSLLSCWSSSLSSSAAACQYTCTMRALSARVQAKHTASRRHAALLIVGVGLCILALVGVVGSWRLALALVGSRGLLVVVLGHGGCSVSLRQAANDVCVVRGWGGADSRCWGETGGCGERGEMYTRRSNEGEQPERWGRVVMGRMDGDEAALAFAYHFRRARAKHSPPPADDEHWRRRRVLRPSASPDVQKLLPALAPPSNRRRPPPGRPSDNPHHEAERQEYSLPGGRRLARPDCGMRPHSSSSARGGGGQALTKTMKTDRNGQSKP